MQKPKRRQNRPARALGHHRLAGPRGAQRDQRLVEAGAALVAPDALLRARGISKGFAEGRLGQDLLNAIERGIALKEAGDPTFAAELRLWLERTTSIFADRILPFGSAEARIWGRLSARLGHDGADLLIAATAMSCGATVVTENVSDFEPTGVQVECPS